MNGRGGLNCPPPLPLTFKLENRESNYMFHKVRQPKDLESFLMSKKLSTKFGLMGFTLN